MGDVIAEPESVGVSADAAETFAELDEVLWNPISRATVLRSAPRFDERVLDACAGDGASALPTAELVGPGGVVDAVDGSEAMIAILRDRAGERMPWLRAHVGDVTAWPYTGYDLVQCALGVFFFDDVAAGVEHLVQCARPGGRVAVTTWAHGALDPLPDVLAEALPADGEGGPDVDAEPDAALEVLESAGALAHWLSERGLVDVRAETVPRHLDLTPEIAWRLVTGTGMRAMLAGLDDAAVAGVRERYLAGTEQRGLTSVDLSTVIAVGRRPEEEPEAAGADGADGAAADAPDDEAPDDES